MQELVEHGFNSKSEVVVFVPPLAGEALSWRPDGTNWIWVRQAGQIDKLLGISPDVRAMAERAGYILLVEVDPAERVTKGVSKLPMLDD